MLRPAKSVRKKPTAANLRIRRVIRSKGEYLGSVEASDREGLTPQPSSGLTWTHTL
jgi:hypothetical protein